ncbi:MAG: aldehyde dehydrogenase family protein [Myxococcaceae bacterium]|nr:aldehyde dehydrogenase family protein [Myxococcaceae bacterium]
MTKPSMVTAPRSPPPTSASEIDAAVKRVKAAAKEFAALPVGDKVALLQRMRLGYGEVAEEAVRLGCQAKGIDFESEDSGEEWLANAMITARIMRLTEEALRDVERYGAPRIPDAHIRELPDGRVAIKVFPANTFDSVLLPHHDGEVFMQKGVTRANLDEHRAVFYKKPHDGRLCVVLGAGNVASISSTDCVYKMFVEGCVCVLKMNPINAYLGPLFERAFAPAIARGFLAIVYGGSEQGAQLANHGLVDELHMTGSDKTYDALVWGTQPQEVADRKARHAPVLTKTVSSELGNISPVIVVPGPYTESELSYQARSIAGMVFNNASFNCVAAKLLVTCQAWEGRRKLLDGIETHLKRAPTRLAYYPGAVERWQRFIDGRPHVRVIGEASEGRLPFALLTDVDASNPNEKVFSEEPWCTVLSETSLPAPDTVGFLRDAVRFVNDRVWGTLCATLIVHPKTLADPLTGAAVDQAIDALRYGSVSLNSFSGAVFAIGSAPWGGHPSSTPQNIQSGSGVVHNTFMLEKSEKFVLRAPLKTYPIALWLPGHRSLKEMGRKLLDFEMSPSWLKVPGIGLSAVGG